MKCEHFISNHEARSAWSRLRARLHANRCPTCAAKLDWLSQVRRQLATTAEITPFHRRVWERAAEAPQPVSRRIASPRFVVAGGLALAAVLMIALLLSLPERDEMDPENVVLHPPQQPSSTIVTRSIEISEAEFAALETGLIQLEADLNRLSEEAARLEVLRAIAELGAQHRLLSSGDST